MFADVIFRFSVRDTIIQVDDRHVIGNRLTVRTGKCRIRIFKESDSEMQSPRVFVLLTELGDENLGPNITAAIREIADQVCLTFGINPFSLVLVEHYDPRVSGDEHGEHFNLVHMPWDGARFGEPVWQHVEKVEVEAMIGEKL